MSNEKISEKEWENGVGNKGNEKKNLEIMKILKSSGRNGISIKGIINESKIKWVYGELMRILKSEKIERKKIGKKYYYRIKK